jgi:hypothetical protein
VPAHAARASSPACSSSYKSKVRPVLGGFFGWLAIRHILLEDWAWRNISFGNNIVRSLAKQFN